MAIPQRDLDRVAAWCEQLTPVEHQHHSRVEFEATTRSVTIIECSVWSDMPPDGWLRVPMARLGYAQATGLWTLYWADRNSKFHLYRGRRPTKRLQSLLDYIETSGDPIFWG